MSIMMLLTMAVELDPERVAVTSGDEHLTYGELLERSLAVGDLLRHDGAEHLALLDLNTAAFPVALFGAAAAGIPLAPLNYRLADERLTEAVGRLNPVALFQSKDVGSVVDLGNGDVARSTGDLLTAARRTGSEIEPDLVDSESPAVLLFTSGTTGTPKIAVLRHRHLFSYVTSTVEFGHAGAEEAIMVSVPNYHIAGISSVLGSIFGGRRIVQLPSFTPESWVATARKESVTHAMVVPTMLGRILDVLQSAGETLPALRHLSYGGGRMPVEVVERAVRMLPHVDFVNAYGLTETSSTVTILDPDDHRNALASDDPDIRGRLGSVGRPVPSIELEIRSEDGNVVAAGEIGEVYVRGEQVSGEYTSHSVVDDEGWYATRDQGHLDSDGFLYLRGRADDIIVRGGENISPEEVEDVLTRHPRVQAAAVVGVPDVEWGERVEAVIVLDGEITELVPELTKWVRERLRSTRVPAAFHVRNELPFNETGKMLRRSLRVELSQNAGVA
ncbi:MAG: long-chain fatty acid--CoA ligase [Rhodococcus sp. (in: high G+C Gram-positive bacteria)]|uniref:class I adenylate-forming enzyme family protein n=1 Tax=Rhodococcus sp. TaxID=1831 RepID=UPI00120B92D9|nr:class I adenylate-forming enzyme family protein [Rhodococcus sp. (in: high G+C Gram-positive bacteria)]RZL23113.1 MAG: long-chain fatty acid--CoA ligase [Rhodococcus sp. (in: high G+C Gram-positive bacteria)]